MDCAPPYVGEGPCCSCKRRGAFTPTLAEEAASTAAKNRSTQVRVRVGCVRLSSNVTHAGNTPSYTCCIEWCSYNAAH
jgi:hypothetical protein